MVVRSDPLSCGPIRPVQRWSDRTRSAVVRSDQFSCSPIRPGQLWSDWTSSAVVRSGQVSCCPIGFFQQLLLSVRNSSAVVRSDQLTFGQLWSDRTRSAVLRLDQVAVVRSDQVNCGSIGPIQLCYDRIRSAVVRSDLVSRVTIGPPGQLWSDRTPAAFVRSGQFSCGPIASGQSSLV